MIGRARWNPSSEIQEEEERGERAQIRRRLHRIRHGWRGEEVAGEVFARERGREVCGMKL
jgi:hypothetical protein